MPSTPNLRTRIESAFTLVEVIITLVLLAVAMAAIFPAIANMMRGNTRSAASSQASGEAGIVARLLESDVRAALGNRGTGERVTVSAAALPSAASTIASLSLRQTTISDIYAAGPQRLHLNADVYPNAGIERVEWDLLIDRAECGDRDRTTGSNFCIQRRIATAANTTLTVEIVARGRGTYPVNTTNCAPGVVAITIPRLFCFRESVSDAGNPADYDWDGGWRPICNVRWNQAGPGTSPNTAGTPLTLTTAANIPTSHNAVDAPNSTRISRLDRITTVGASILAGGGFGKSSERSYEQVEIAIRSRENEAYREAIMCGARAGWGR